MEPLVIVFSLAGLAALGVKLLSTVKYLLGRDMNGFVTQMTAFGIGVGLVALAAHSSGFAHVPLNGVKFGLLNMADQVYVGLCLGGLGSFAYDFKKARDNADSSAEPALLGPARSAADKPPC